jgi:GT2 family glycosyltransferase
MKPTTSNYAAFIMTYRRPEILNDTIIKLLNQTAPPNKILIIDNDPLKSAQTIAENNIHNNVEYFATGYNSGPAGAAKKGLEKLSAQGFSWIAWIDDDNPPIFDNIFESLLQIANSAENLGCVGTVGQFFNRKNGIMKRVLDEELDGVGNIEVDNIAGGMCKLINAKVIVENNILPDEKLFYGFEELDFDLRLQSAGYHLLTNKELYKKHRLFYNRMNLQVNRGKRKQIKSLWREYYSTRNILIVLKKQKLYKAIILTIARSNLKIFLGFRYGIVYGFKNAKLISLALWHFLTAKTGSLKGIHE